MRIGTRLRQTPPHLSYADSFRVPIPPHHRNPPCSMDYRDEPGNDNGGGWRR